jgi:NAD(P)-dependent dehydrogenase (short-subunit alcohol dehydrogenase family)
MRIPDTAVLVTGANRGLGRALVEEALRRGAKRVYAGTRQPLPHSGRRVTPLTLDVTNVAQIQGATDAGIRDRYDNGWIGAGGSFDKLSAFLAKGVLS